jgi:hypothetical protein
LRKRRFEKVFARIYPLLAAKGKPILIGETASAEVGGNKAEWIDAIIPTLRTKYPMIKGLVWFDVNKERDWRINSSPPTLEAFARAAQDPYWCFRYLLLMDRLHITLTKALISDFDTN